MKGNNITQTGCSGKYQAERKTAGDLLPLLHRESCGILYLSVVRRLLSSRQESSSEGHQRHTDNHRMPSVLPGRHLQLPLPLQSQKHAKQLFLSWTPPVRPVALWQAPQDHQGTDHQTKEQLLSFGHKHT